MKSLITIIILLFSINSFGYKIPDNNKASFDIIRKNKIIGNIITTFNKKNDKLIIETILNIEVKVLFIPAYKFYQRSKETWLNDQFIEFDGYTDFEDDREYFVTGKLLDNGFLISGMDGKKIVKKNIFPLNYWDINILNQEEVFDTQKGIIRKINTEKLPNEIIIIDNIEIKTKKFKLNASKNPKDLGPFPEYTLWYSEDNELIKFKFTNWKDKKEIITIRNNWIKK